MHTAPFQKAQYAYCALLNGAVCIRLCASLCTCTPCHHLWAQVNLFDLIPVSFRETQLNLDNFEATELCVLYKAFALPLAVLVARQGSPNQIINFDVGSFHANRACEFCAGLHAQVACK